MMNIYLTDLETGNRLRFPMLPQKINVQAGAIFQSYTILGAGDVKLPFGEQLTGFSWDGILPGKARRKTPFVTQWKDPKSIQKLWNGYKTKKKKLRLLITGTPVNMDVYLEDYSIDYQHGYGDYAYRISLVQAKNIEVKVSKNAAAATSKTTRPSPPAPKTHKVVSGNTLWGIAQKYYGKGADYPKIYNANKALIEATAKKYGKKNSDNGHWIYPGTVLTIP